MRAGPPGPVCNLRGRSRSVNAFRSTHHPVRHRTVRLTQLKLAGFKSFVDPTVIPVPSQLVGVVGPNGCGKSNIIDAVRWVLGEAKASELRGESMQDVIFNGSGNRKPAARVRGNGVRQQRRARRRPVEHLRRDRGAPGADPRRHQQLFRQQPAGPPPRHPRHLPGHRPGRSRLRHHRPGHDQPPDRGAPRRTAGVPGRGCRRVSL